MTNPNGLGGNTNPNPANMSPNASTDNDLAAAWASITDSPNEFFNPNPQQSPDVVKPKTELSPDEKEKISRKLRKEFLDTAEHTSKNQHEAYGYLNKSLKESGCGALANTVENFDVQSRKIDAGRTKALIDYIDLKFASGPGVEKSRAEAREHFEKASTAYSADIDSSLLYIGQGLPYLFNGALMGNANGFLQFKKSLPEGQKAASRSLLNYIDNPSKDTKKQLEDTLTKYDASLGDAFYFFAGNIEAATPRNNEVPDSIRLLSDKTRKGHEDIYKALISYYDFKRDNYQGDASVDSQPLESSLPKPRIQVPRRPNSSKIMSDEQLRREIP
ncbi:hypothetical protein IKT18_00420 [Candidatus Saccharibacteria bacterium]|nr:hypothetical protein [Candidatus Saccharibacteria bacterium]